MVAKPEPLLEQPVEEASTRYRPGLWLARKLLFLWARMTVLPDEPVRENGIDTTQPVFYVLETEALSDLLVLEQLCRRFGLARPTTPPVVKGLENAPGYCAIRRRERRFGRKPARTPAPALRDLIDAAKRDASVDVQIVPVAIFWGRAPDRQKSAWRALFTDSWGFTNPFRRFFTIVFQGRSLLVQVSRPASLRQLADEDLDLERSARKLSRILRVHLRRLRIATIGPDLSHRRTLVDQILENKYVRDSIERAAARRQISVDEAAETAREYANEIAAEYSQPFVRFMDRFLSWLWNKLYDGIELYHLDHLKDVTQGNELVYVPSHRSHIDYLLLSYVLYYQALMPPHIAAGVNLNLPIIGRFLRRGGAFFIRRSFHGNRLYTAVFHQYLSSNLIRGVPIEYFIEGGRSRTGRLLKPKGGLLAMTVRSFLHDSRRPIVFLPVYIGFEKLVEGQTYLGELSGQVKRKESALDIFRAPRFLKGDFGKVHVSFGRSIHLGSLLDRVRPDWRAHEYSLGDRPDWLDEAVATLGEQILKRVNDAAVVTPINLLALALLSTPNQAMTEQELQRQLQICIRLLGEAPYSSSVSVSCSDPAEIIVYGEKMKVLVRQSHPLGDILKLEEHNAILMTYFRNNIIHLVALPSLIACCFVNNKALDFATVLRLCEFVYPYIRSELFLRWEDGELEQVIREILDVLVAADILGIDELGRYARPPLGSYEAGQLTVLSQGVLQTLQRFYMTMALLLQRGSNAVTQGKLENECQMVAQRLSLLHELNAPEFFDKSLFRNFLYTLRDRKIISVDANGLLEFDKSIEDKHVDADLLLSEAVRHRILQVIRP